MGTSTHQKGAGSQHLQPNPTRPNPTAPRQSRPNPDPCAGGLGEAPPRGPEGLRGPVPSSTVMGGNQPPPLETGQAAMHVVRAIRGAAGEHGAHEHARAEARARIAHQCLGGDGEFLTRCRPARNSPADKRCEHHCRRHVARTRDPRATGRRGRASGGLAHQASWPQASTAGVPNPSACGEERGTCSNPHANRQLERHHAQSGGSL